VCILAYLVWSTARSPASQSDSRGIYAALCGPALEQRLFMKAAQPLPRCRGRWQRVTEQRPQAKVAPSAVALIQAVAAQCTDQYPPLEA
jgi:hypothetical protein